MTSAGGAAGAIRRAVLDDAPALADLRYRFRAEMGTPVEDRTRFLARCQAWMGDRLRTGGAWSCWLAARTGETAGAVWLQLLEKIPNPVGEPELHGYLSSLFVDPAHRGRGLGSALIEACLAACQARGVDAVFLWPTPSSRPLYRRHGFDVRDDLLERRFERAIDGPPH